MDKKEEILLHDYFDNLLSEKEQKEFEETLFDNIELAISLGKLKNLQRNLRNLTSHFEPSDKVIENIIDSLLEEEKKATPVNEEKKTEQKKEKKTRVKKERKKLKAKTKFRLKRILAFVVFLLAIGLIGVGYYFYHKENSSFPWRVTPTSDKVSAKLQTIIVNGINSGNTISTSDNESISIAVDNQAIITLGENSEIKIITGTHSQNSIEFKKGNLNFVPQSGNILFKIKYKNIEIFSTNAQLEIEMQNKDNTFVRVINNYITIHTKTEEDKIPSNHIFQFLGSNSITIPILANAKKDFSKLVYNYTLEPNDKNFHNILNMATKKNSFTLFFMLRKTPATNRELIINKLQEYFPLPNSISKVDILMLDDNALNTWWDEIYRATN